MTSSHPYPLLFAYNQWASDKLLDVAARLSPEQLHTDPGLGVGSVWRVLSHLIAAEETWVSRMRGTSPSALPDYTTLPDFPAVAATLRRTNTATAAFVNTLTAADLDQDLVYRRTGGEEQRQPVWQILLHLANHATDHRSQIGAALNHFGIAGPQLDMIFFLRTL